MEITVILLTIIVAALLAREIRSTYDRIAELERRLRKLELAGRQRLPHAAADELLDAMAVLDMELSKKQIELDYLENVKGHITNAMSVGTKRQP